MSKLAVDTLIIGCGIAGATAALRLSEDPQRYIAVITRVPDLTNSNSHLAQGGIVTRGLDDNPDLLVADIMQAGAGLSSRAAAELLAIEGPRLVQKILIDQCGVHFDKDTDGGLAFGLEAAHSRRRVVHVGDQTGAAIMNQLLRSLAPRPNIDMLTECTALDLIIHEQQGAAVCCGATVFDYQRHEVVTIHAHHTIVATGGIGQLYQRTTNPLGARGDGIAMAWRAGLSMQNMEYVQFHPTALALDDNPLPLISEAVRGEGAVLVTPDGIPFMYQYAPEWGDLAPRDVVARSIYTEMQAHGYPYVFLDVRGVGAHIHLETRFPTLVENCRRAGLDPYSDLIPVVPVAHYFCGGIPVDTWGRTELVGLYAVGEVSCTGIHGANRLASTSLLEGLVWGHQAAEFILHQPISPRLPQGPDDVTIVSAPPLSNEDLTPYRFLLQSVMWDNVGIVRTTDSLQFAYRTLTELRQQVEALYQAHQLSDALIGLRNAVHTALLITHAALENTESRGAHFRQDVEKIPL